MKGAKELSNHKNKKLRILNSINTSKMFRGKENWIKWLVKEDIRSINYLDMHIDYFDMQRLNLKVHKHNLKM